ncbi:ABC transporter permease subunit [Candidatus Igneacidithiobacillus taiwanensis]|uniref:ABC transporter permease n=1 Tax=Candidatus Igneacidithiobacillus taiwanensis TaxID=1945924 RepID=UPI0028A077CC|nr:ABC transporter permease subunit [Candidatus Igneacidithiobacillus taiwanensis]
MSRFLNHLLVYLILGVLVLAPLGAILYEALLPDAGTGQGIALLHLGVDRHFLHALLGTLGMAGFAVLYALPLGLALALLMFYAPPRLAPLWEVLILIPFLIPPYLTAEAWSLLAGPVGLIEQVIHFGGTPLEEFLYSLAGMGAVMALHLTPLVYIMLRASLENGNFRLWQAARVHGAGVWAAFRLALLPLLLPALAAAGLLVFLDTSAEFGVPALLAGYAGVSVLSTSIESAVNVWPVDLPRAAAIGLVLCTMGVIVWLFYRPLVRENRSQIQQSRNPRRYFWSLLPLALFALIGTLLPLSAILVVSFEKALTAGLEAGNFTWRHYHHVLSHQSSAFSALRTSLELAALVAVLGMVAALLAANIVRRGGRIAAFVDLLATLPMAIPGVVLAVGMILFWNAPWNTLPIFGHPIVLAIAYATVTFPFAMRYARTGLAQIPPRLEQAGRVHGASPIFNVLRVQIPLAWPMLVGGATVVFALSMRELVASLLLQPAGTQVISTYIYGNFRQGIIGDGMAMSVIGIFSSALILGLARGALLRR